MSESRGSTKMCSVLFVDIVGYSKKTNSEQIALKERFVALWSQAIQEVPSGDIMVVDAGDGAAMTSLVEPEDSIRVAQKLRELLEGEISGEPMLLRMGINFGPVQLSTDVHGKACVVGDAINIAQRIMSFADPGQIMVSRSYYDVILPLSHKYQEMFYYLGKRADKHIRYHDVYGLGEPSQSAALGQTATDGLMDLKQDHADTEELKFEPVPAPAAAAKPVAAQSIQQPYRPGSSWSGKVWRWFRSVLGNLFFIFKFALILLVIYELFVLVPVIKKPDQVRLEINNQILEAKEIWTGFRAAEETIKPLLEGRETSSTDSQPAVPAAEADAKKRVPEK